MFEDSLVESSGRLAQRNPWTTAISFTMQMLAAGLLVLLPLIYTDALPKKQLMSFLETPAPPPASAPKPLLKAAGSKHVSQFENGILRPPAEIPNKIAKVKDEEAPEGIGTGAVPFSIPGVPNGTSNAVITDVIRNTPAAVPKIAVQKVRVSSGVAQGLLIHEVKPQYPALARQARIQGTVVLQAVIDKEGKVQHLQVVSGHPLLIQAAMDAVKQWRYKPYYLNGEPVEVDTQININFTLSGG
jgi:periplasmic protein TonB